MNESAVSAPPPVTDGANASSFFSRSADVFAAPGDLFREVAATPVQTSSWLVPLLLSVLVAIVFVAALHFNPAIQQQMIDLQQQKMEKAVAEGKMSQETADRTSEMMSSGGGTMFLIFGSISAAVVVAVIMFAMALVFWLIARFALKFPGKYNKMLEVVGLSSMIGILGTIVTILVMYVFNSMHATPSAALLVLGSYDPSSFAHRLLSQIGVFMIWQMIVLGIGVSRVSNRPTSTGIGIALGLWALWAIAASLLSWGS